MMSKIGKKPITIHPNVKVEINIPNIKLTSDKGKVKLLLPSYLDIKREEDKLLLSMNKEEPEKKEKAMFGTFRQLLSNAITGLNDGYKQTILIVGVGYEVIDEGARLCFRLGFSHNKYWDKKQEFSYKVEKKTQIEVFGIDKASLHQEVAKMKALRKPNRYDGYGLRLSDEVIILKEKKKER